MHVLVDLCMDDDDDARVQMVSYHNEETQSSSDIRRLSSSQVKPSQVKSSASHEVKEKKNLFGKEVM